MMFRNISIIFFIAIFFNIAQAKVYFEPGRGLVVQDAKEKVYKKTKKIKKYYKTRNKYKKRIKYSKRRPKGKVSRTGSVRFKGHTMPISVANKLRELESMFGKIRIISSCRKGARVRKTGRPSMHSYCRAVDFIPPRGLYWKVAIWLKLNWSGGVGTYSGRHNHIHIDDNRGRWHN